MAEVTIRFDMAGYEVSCSQSANVIGKIKSPKTKSWLLQYWDELESARMNSRVRWYTLPLKSELLQKTEGLGS